MPRKPKRGYTWMSVELPDDIHEILTHAAKQDGRSLNQYLARVLLGHAMLLRITDQATKNELVNLSTLPPAEQLRVLQKVSERFKTEVVDKAKESKA